jgi:hypothetical protein
MLRKVIGGTFVAAAVIAPLSASAQGVPGSDDDLMEKTSAALSSGVSRWQVEWVGQQKTN